MLKAFVENANAIRDTDSPMIVLFGLVGCLSILFS